MIGQRSTSAIVVFVLFVAGTLILTYWAARRTRSAEDFFAAGRRVKGWQNGLALAGDFIAAAGFLGVPGLIALVGFDACLMATMETAVSKPMQYSVSARSLSRVLGTPTIGAPRSASQWATDNVPSPPMATTASNSLLMLARTCSRPPAG